MAARRKRQTDPPLLVVEISLGSSARDHDVAVEFLGRPVRLVRIGTDGDLRVAEELVRRWGVLADAVAVNGATEAQATGALDVDAAVAIRRLMSAAPDGSVTDGRRLHEVLQEWSVRWVQNEMPGYFSNARTVVLGPDHARTVGVLREFTDNIDLHDPGARDGVGQLDPRPLLGAGRPRPDLAAAPGERGRPRGHRAAGPARQPGLARTLPAGQRRRRGGVPRARHVRA